MGFGKNLLNAASKAIASQRLLRPPSYRLFYWRLRNQKFRLLDVGCGNHSASRTRRWFPRCLYHGIDRGVYNNSEDDFRQMEAFYDLDLTTGCLSAVPDETFDLVLVNHVIEHIPNGLEVLGRLTGKLKPGGRIYVEYPSVRSLSLPSMRGTLNFCDDPTHIRLYGLDEVATVLSAGNMKILRAGARRDWLHIALFPLLVLPYWFQGYPAAAFWDLLGFADYVYAERGS